MYKYEMTGMVKMTTRKKIRISKTDRWLYDLPIILAAALVPLVVRLKILSLGGDLYYYWTGEQTHYDFFSYYKAELVMVLAGVSLAVYLLGIWKNEKELIRPVNYHWLLLTYTLFILLSTIFSQHQGVAMWGFVDRYEGAVVLVSYIVLFIFTSEIVRNENSLRRILWGIFISAAGIGFIGIFQYIGKDLWLSNFGKWLILPPAFRNVPLRFSVGIHAVYASLYHPDYVGSYTAMLLPLGLTFTFSQQKFLWKLISGLITALILVIWLTGGSRAGIVGGLVGIIVLAILLRKKIKIYAKYLIIGVLFVSVLFVMINITGGGNPATRIKLLLSDAGQLFNQKNSVSTSDTALKDIKVDHNRATIKTNIETLNIDVENGQLSLSDENMNPLHFEFSAKDGNILLKDTRYKTYNITLGYSHGIRVLRVKKDTLLFDFALADNRINLVDNKGQPVYLSTIEKWGFNGKERLGSSRGYIWSRSIPLLRHSIILGYGPDTFPMIFPQNDILGKTYAYNDPWQLIDKPHDLYLQIALSTGVISLIAILALFILYIYKSIKIYINADYKNTKVMIGSGIFAAICGYLITGFFNDSVVSVAPVFWVLLGTGTAINQMLMPDNSPMTKNK